MELGTVRRQTTPMTHTRGTWPRDLAQTFYKKRGLRQTSRGGPWLVGSGSGFVCCLRAVGSWSVCVRWVRGLFACDGFVSGRVSGMISGRVSGRRVWDVLWDGLWEVLWKGEGLGAHGRTDGRTGHRGSRTGPHRDGEASPTTASSPFIHESGGSRRTAGRPRTP